MFVIKSVKLQQVENDAFTQEPAYLVLVETDLPVSVMQDSDELIDLLYDKLESIGYDIESLEPAESWHQKGNVLGFYADSVFAQTGEIEEKYAEAAFANSPCENDVFTSKYRG
jgi:hypothetical protein